MFFEKIINKNLKKTKVEFGKIENTPKPTTIIIKK